MGADAAEYGSVKQLMLEAIDASGGSARGVIVGRIAANFGATTGSVAPIVDEVSTIKSFKQEGCKLLNVRFKQGNVPTKDRRLADFSVAYGLNLCRDSSPPTEGMDLDAASRVLSRQPQ